MSHESFQLGRSVIGYGLRSRRKSGFGFPEATVSRLNVGLWHSLVFLPFVLSFFRLKNVVANSTEG